MKWFVCAVFSAALVLTANAARMQAFDDWTPSCGRINVPQGWEAPPHDPRSMWSHDGGLIAFTNYGEGVYLADVERGMVVEVLSERIIDGPYWSPDGTWLLVVTGNPHGANEVSRTEQAVVQVVDVAGGDVTALARQWTLHAQWDGDDVIFSRVSIDTQIVETWFRVGEDGEAVEIAPPLETEADTQTGVTLEASEDTRQIVDFSRGAHNNPSPYTRPDSRDLYLRYGETTYRLTGFSRDEAAPVFYSDDEVQATWSPDGTQLAFYGAEIGHEFIPAIEAWRPRERFASLFVISADGCNLRRFAAAERFEAG